MFARPSSIYFSLGIVRDIVPLFIPLSDINLRENKARHTATLVACGWAGAVLEKVTRAVGQEPFAQKAQKRQKNKKRDQPTYQPTNQPTDQATDQPTNGGV